MSHLSENYNLRQFYLKHDQVPSQETMRRTIPPPLTPVFLQAISPKQKALMEPEPSITGAVKGFGWYVPPKDLLEGRAVKRPLKDEHLQNLTHGGIINLGYKAVIAHRNDQKKELDKIQNSVDEAWVRAFNLVHKQQWEESVMENKQKNSEHIKNVFNTFSILYKKSLTRIEELFHEAVIKQVRMVEDEATEKGKSKYKVFLKKQAIMLNERYAEKLENEKEKLKNEFIEKLEINRTETTNKIHDISIEKYATIERLRKFYECQNLACQIYVTLKERECFVKENEISKHEFKKNVKPLIENLQCKDLQLSIVEEKIRKQEEINLQWQKKVCHVVKKFQMFVSYCLRLLPEHAEFFINLEKLMLLQLNKALEEPSAESIIEVDKEHFATPIPKPHPFYLFCDRGYKAQVEQNLCPKHCTSSASQLPVIIINKQCMYAACDNFDQFSYKVKQYIYGNCGHDDDIQDSIISADYVPVKYTTSQQLLELKLESSLLQVLQQEMTTLKEDPVLCDYCQRPGCFCVYENGHQDDKEDKEIKPDSSGIARTASTEIDRLSHERKPHLKEYFEFIKPRRCSCAKTAKKHLEEHLPAYMRHVSKYEPPDLPNYETCSVATLKKLVKEAKGIPTPPISKIPSETKKDMSTQYIDEEFQKLCTCFSDNEMLEFLNDPSIIRNVAEPPQSDQFQVVAGSMSPTYLNTRPSSFALDRAQSLIVLADDLRELRGMFRRKYC